jgi:tricorn protease
VIGKRSWGGVVGIRGSLPLLDGGYLNKPEFSRYDAEGKEWIMEGKGVEPDIYIDNDPAREFAGEDQQLDKAIESSRTFAKNRLRRRRRIPTKANSQRSRSGPSPRFLGRGAFVGRAAAG